MLAHALAYAAAGWPTFPLRPGGKVPATRRGFHDASTDPDVIEQWWTRMPGANVGIATGRLVVIDIDAKDGAPGWQSWCDLLGVHVPAGPEPVTWEVDTPTGGAHFYYLAPAVPIRNSAGKLGAGIDVRGAGGYVVAPPSVVPAGRYTMARTMTPRPLPDWLHALLVPTRPARQPFASLRRRLETAATGHRYGETAFDREVAAVRSAGAGTRNDTLVRAAFNLGQLVDRGDLDRYTVTTALLDAAQSAGLTESEALATIRSGFNGARDKPRGAVA